MYGKIFVVVIGARGMKRSTEREKAMSQKYYDDKEEDFFCSFIGCITDGFQNLCCG